AQQAVRSLTGRQGACAAPQRRSVVGLGPDQAGVTGALAGCDVTDRAIDLRSVRDVGVAAGAVDGPRDVDRRRAGGVDLARGDGGGGGGVLSVRGLGQPGGLDGPRWRAADEQRDREQGLDGPEHLSLDLAFSGGPRGNGSPANDLSLAFASAGRVPPKLRTLRTAVEQVWQVDAGAVSMGPSAR